MKTKHSLSKADLLSLTSWVYKIEPEDAVAAALIATVVDFVNSWPLDLRVYGWDVICKMAVG